VTWLYNSDEQRAGGINYAGNSVRRQCKKPYSCGHADEHILREPANGSPVQTLYDEQGHWVGDYAADGSPIKQAIWLDDYPVALLGPQTQAASLAYVEPDHLGTPRVVIDSERDVAIWRWPLERDAFGAHAPEEDPDGDGVTYALNLRFPGQQYTQATGLYYNYQRDLDAATGRYVQSDPIGLAGGVSTYGYVGGRPVSYSDPLGLDADVFIWKPLPYEGGLPSYGKLHSTFGHVSVQVDGASFSLGPSGMNTDPNYPTTQRSLRGAVSHRIRLTQLQDAELLSCLKSSDQNYSSISNNCAAPIQNCLRKMGLGLSPLNAVFPATLNVMLFGSALTESSNSLGRRQP